MTPSGLTTLGIWLRVVDPKVLSNYVSRNTHITCGEFELGRFWRVITSFGRSVCRGFKGHARRN